MANIWYGAKQYPAGRSSPSDGNWRNPNNWYLSVGQDGACCCTITDAIPANRVPTNTDVVYLYDGTVDITTGPVSTFTGAVQLYAGGVRAPSLNAGTYSGTITQVTIGGGTYSGTMNTCVLNAGTTSGPMNSCTINGGNTSNTLTSCTINGGTNTGSLVTCIVNYGTYSSSFTIAGAGGTAVFNGNMICTGNIQGTPTFNGALTTTGGGRIAGGSPVFNGTTTMSLNVGLNSIITGTPVFSGGSVTLGDSAYDPFISATKTTGPYLSGYSFNVPVTIWVVGKTEGLASGGTSPPPRFFQCNFNAGLTLKIQSRCLDNAQTLYFPDIVFKNCTRFGLPFNTINTDILGAGLL